jgi:hypothetical protein
VRGFIPRECLDYLARNPFRRRICSDVDPDEISPVQTDDDEGIEQVEVNSRNYKEVHGGNVRRVIAQKGTPSLAWRAAPPNHVLGDRRLRDGKAELKQFAVDAWRAPQRILNAHLPDKFT